MLGDSSATRVELETEDAGVASAISVVELTPCIRANITVVIILFISNIYKQINLSNYNKTNRIAL